MNVAYSARGCSTIGIFGSQFDLTPSIRHDGLEIAFASDRPGGAGGRDLWSATRSSVNGTWSTPINLGVVVNSALGENFPSLSADRTSAFPYLVGFLNSGPRSLPRVTSAPSFTR